ncbi:MAG: segregation/condensation protein A [Planctomycetales bacterium]
METSINYRVHLDVFTGPLDLLLFLVRRHEVDIENLPIARIANQFQEYIDVLEMIDLDLVGDFVVMASTLAEIKSRMVLPRPEEEPDLTAPVEDPRTDLVRQLLEYKKFKDAAKLLDEHAAQWQEHYPRLSDERPTLASDPAQDHIKEVELWDLVSALSRILRHNVTTNPTSIVYDDTPISVYVQRIYFRVQEQERVRFSDLFENSGLRSKIVGIFLAILELLRHYKLRAEQPEAYGEIWVLPPKDGFPETPPVFLSELEARPGPDAPRDQDEE